MCLSEMAFLDELGWNTKDRFFYFYLLPFSLSQQITLISINSHGSGSIQSFFAEPKTNSCKTSGLCIK